MALYFLAIYPILGVMVLKPYADRFVQLVKEGDRFASPFLMFLFLFVVLLATGYLQMRYLAPALPFSFSLLESAWIVRHRATRA